jgi:hypothetical protein
MKILGKETKFIIHFLILMLVFFGGIFFYIALGEWLNTFLPPFIMIFVGLVFVGLHMVTVVTLCDILDKANRTKGK